MTWPGHGNSLIRRKFLKFDDPVLFVFDIVLLIMFFWAIPIILCMWCWDIYKQKKRNNNDKNATGIKNY